VASLQVEGTEFIYDGKPLRIISGAMHYFRIVPAYWQDRLQKLKACGFNTVETYVPWNYHEPKPGQFQFEGMADIVHFIKTAADLDLFVIVRPSPYICAEWEFGGLPSWLLAEPGMRLRCYNDKFLSRVDAYYDVLMPKLKPLLSTNGGPIIAMQIENEYGSYGNDSRYLDYIKQGMASRGIDVLLFTSDGPTDSLLQGGSVSEVLATVNFGSGPRESFLKLRQYQKDGPLMCMEYWNGWFDHWGEKHHTRDASDAASVFEEMLKENASVNFYMFHGGTNFGFYNGANCQQPDQYEPTITSYDYDALLTESGEPSEKYFAVREVLARYADIGELTLPEPIAAKAYGRVNMTGQASLLSQLDKLTTAVHSTCPEPMEKLGQDYGFILYSTRISGPREEQELVVQHVRDRALIFVNGACHGVLERGDRESSILLEVPPEGAEISILVENMGRINYGPYMTEYKGITEGVRHGFQFLFDWTIHPLPLTDISQLQYEEIQPAGVPAFYRGTLQVDQPADTFLDMEGWTKGVVFLNGFNLGRYWSKGPQRRLYVPGPLLRQGENDLVIFELHGCQEAAVMFADTSMLEL
jgi:beta-galactosidase